MTQRPVAQRRGGGGSLRLGGRRVVLCLGLVAAGWLVGCARHRPDATADPIVVVGFDGADWQWIDPLAADGRLPHFRSLQERGVRADLLSLTPLQKSPTIWTSIATGKRPIKHGVGGFLRASGRLQTAAGRQAATYWEVLGALGRTQAVVGWWVTYPATPVHGVLVSDYIQYFPGGHGRVEGAVYPESAWSWMDSLRVNPDALTLADLARFIDVDVAAAHSGRARELLADLRWIYAGDETYRRIARELYRRGRFDVFTVYFRGLDAVSHKYWRYVRPRSVSFQQEKWAEEMLAGLLSAYHEYADELLGEIVGYVAPDSRIIVCSDHGFVGHRRTERGITTGVAMHRREGILLMAGPGVRAGARLQRAGVMDLFPTLLALSGLPPARDLDGSILLDAFEPGFHRWCRSLKPDAVDSYEDLVPRRAVEAGTPPEVEAEARKRLRSLGYIE